ncbi:MAG: thioester reductase domain-containing protein, partial [Pyrinomonadaceae bacterium]|nr:thioester reductase domain-containing protein [Pyrinomonadaceae bacterium]
GRNMTALHLTEGGALRPRLAQLAADVLRIPVADIEPAVPLAAMGLDSLAAAELTALIEDELSDELPPAVLFECPTLESLSRFIESRAAGAPIQGSDECTRETSIAGMLADAILPAEIVPACSQDRVTDNVLLTGSTGFVGAYLLRSLLRDTPGVIYCLVRPNGTEASARVRRNLEQYGIWEEYFAPRIHCVDGDITQPLLGMDRQDFRRTAGSIGAIYHAAAAVDWVRPYEELRDVNVFGTRELLRFAGAGTPKSFHFLSSLAVCYSTGATDDALESDDPLTNLRGLRLGYAQSKCVAESLVRQAAERGIRATVARPTLVSGDSTSGISNADDLLSRFLRGCIDMGTAPDLDWVMDCVPVDHVADAMVRLARNGVPGGVYHLVNPKSRYWRECVLWMCLRGYQLELMPYRDWMVRLRETATASHPLYPLQAFFLRTVPEEGGLAVPELYEEPRRRRTRCDFSRAVLSQAGTTCPPLDADLLDRYFDWYTERGLVPAVARATAVRRDTFLSSRLVTALECSLRRRSCDSALRITNVELFPMGGDDGIVAELTSWRRGHRVGLRRAQLTTESDGCTSVIDLVLKSKPLDTDAIEVGEQVARLCGRHLGDAYATWRDHIGLTRGHLRELAIYETDDHGLRLHVPAPLVVLRDDDRGEWLLALEYVSDAQVANAWHRAWIPSEIDVALRGLAALHAVWHDRLEALVSQSWLAPRRSSEQMAEMLPLWSALAANARPAFTSWAGPALAQAHESLLCGIDRWWRPLGGNPQTLIHNDFNPRNIMLRGLPGVAQRLCAYDWELATIGAPQRDLAEFLCFALAPETAADDASTWVQRYRGLLEEQTATTIDPIEWEAGFRAALCDFLVDRLAMYAMIHHFRPQAFLPRVVRAWLALHNRFPWPTS